MQQRTSHNKTFPLNSLGGEIAVLKEDKYHREIQTPAVYASTLT